MEMEYVGYLGVFIILLLVIRSVRLANENSDLREEKAVNERKERKERIKEKTNQKKIAAALKTLADVALKRGEKEEEQLETLPQIEPIIRAKEALRRTKGELRKKLSFGMGPEFQAGVAQFTAQLWESINKSKEIRDRVSLEDLESAQTASLYANRGKYHFAFFEQAKKGFEEIAEKSGLDPKCLQSFFEHYLKTLAGANAAAYFSKLIGQEVPPPKFIEPSYFPLTPALPNKKKGKLKELKDDIFGHHEKRVFDPDEIDDIEILWWDKSKEASEDDFGDNDRE